MQEAQNYYDILGVDVNIPIDGIRKAYKQKALECHPDKPNGDEKQFRLINEAYAVLSNEKKRRLYDKCGKEGMQSHDDQSCENKRPNLFQFMDPFRVFKDVFMREQSNDEENDSQDIVYDLLVSPKELFFGCEKKLAVHRKKFCRMCNGLGISPDYGHDIDIRCIQCKGTGVNVCLQKTFLGSKVLHSRCTFCNGQGIKAPITMTKCIKCQGNRLVDERHIFTVKVQAGTPEQWKITCKNEGNDSLLAGEGTGDVILTVVSPLPEGWYRQGQNILYRQLITLSECLSSGYALTIQSLSGEMLCVSCVEVIKPTIVSKDGLIFSAFVLKDKGLCRFGDLKQGSLIIIFEIIFPTLRIESSAELVDTLFLPKPSTPTLHLGTRIEARPCTVKELNDISCLVDVCEETNNTTDPSCVFQ